MFNLCNYENARMHRCRVKTLSVVTGSILGIWLRIANVASACVRCFRNSWVTITVTQLISATFLMKLVKVSRGQCTFDKQTIERLRQDLGFVYCSSRRGIIVRMQECYCAISLGMLLLIIPGIPATNEFTGNPGR